jgi:hypothetical protein
VIAERLREHRIILGSELGELRKQHLLLKSDVVLVRAPELLKAFADRFGVSCFAAAKQLTHPQRLMMVVR